MSRGYPIRRADPVEERPDHPGVALDRPPGTGAALLLGEEGDDRLSPGRDVVAELGGRELGVHRRSPERKWSPTSITQVAQGSNTMSASCANSVEGDPGSSGRPRPCEAAWRALASPAAAEGALTPRIAYTVGYQGIDVDTVVAAARRAGVTIIVDTRRHPTSRRPSFRREALRRRLEADGIQYVSEPRLGVPKRVRPLARSRPWLFQAAYRGVLSRAASAVEDTVRMAGRETIALLCFEAEAGECHRSLLATCISASASITFVNLDVGRVEHPDDHPVLEDMVGAHQ